MNLDKLLKAKSFVIIGANDKPGFGLGSATNIPKGSGVRVYYLNPNREQLLGKHCFHSLEELPEIPDCMAMVVPKKIVNTYLEEGGKLGIKSAIVFASGFAEEGSAEGIALEKEAIEICKKYDITLCGPNCIGFQNYIDSICGSDADPRFGEIKTEKGCGFVSQSGLITGGVIRMLRDKLAYAVSAGNGPVCSVEDYLLYFATDSNVNVLAAYIEGIRNANTFYKALQEAYIQKKPVILLKSGKSLKGAKSAASHTGNMAGSYEVFLSVCQKFGVIMTDSLEEFTETVKIFTILDGKLPKKEGMAGINFSGGENTLFADLCDKYKLQLPTLNDFTIDKLNLVVPDYCTPSNPLDATATMFRQEDRVEELFRIFAEDENIGTIILGSDMSVAEQIKEVISARVLSRLSRNGVLQCVFILPSYSQERSKELVELLEEVKIPILPAGELAYEILKNIMTFAFLEKADELPELSIISQKFSDETNTLAEFDAEKILLSEGIPFPRMEMVSEKTDIKSIISNLSSPYVMKIASKDILHKTEAGGVKLAISTLEEAEEAYDEILLSAKAYNPNAQVEGVIIQEMIPIKEGIELIVGVKSDAQFGPMLLIGFGGIYTELFRDMAICPCPVNNNQAEKMIKSLKSFPLLDGFRKTPKMDVEALIQLIVKVSDFAVTHNELKELDLNPVVVLPKGKGVLAADALITFSK